MIVTELSKSESERNAIRNDDSVGVFVAFITIIMTFDFIKHKKSTWGYRSCTETFYSVVNNTAINQPY